MKSLLKLEELAMLAVSIYALVLFDAPWWCYLLMALGPDISMIGYAAGAAVGAISYNIFHHKGVAFAVFLAGLYLQQVEWQIAGIIIFGHASMDRIFGYGLKYKDSFQHTHLGMIGKKVR
jgi:hypothetical protein